MEMTIQAEFAALVPVLVGILAALKSAGFETRYIPALALLAGILLGGFLTSWNPIEMIIVGGGIGLSAIGAHSGIKNTLEK
jgi:asparagine N-glycosylation enzyme membrane subunit Stt3